MRTHIEITVDIIINYPTSRNLATDSWLIQLTLRTIPLLAPLIDEIKISPFEKFYINRLNMNAHSKLWLHQFQRILKNLIMIRYAEPILWYSFLVYLEVLVVPMSSDHRHRMWLLIPGFLLVISLHLWDVIDHYKAL